MSATKKIGRFEVAIDPLWDPEMERWYVYIGMREKGTIEPHFAAYGKSPEVASSRAEIMARVYRYCAETSYRFNSRKIKDKDRFVQLLSKTEGRLTYNELINKQK